MKENRAGPLVIVGGGASPVTGNECRHYALMTKVLNMKGPEPLERLRTPATALSNRVIELFGPQRAGWAPRQRGMYEPPGWVALRRGEPSPV